MSQQNRAVVLFRVGCSERAGNTLACFVLRRAQLTAEKQGKPEESANIVKHNPPHTAAAVYEGAAQSVCTRSLQCMQSCQHYAAGCQDNAGLCSRLPADLNTVRLRHPLVTLACQVLLCKSSRFKKVNFSCCFEESSLEVCKRQSTKSQLTVGFVPQNGGSSRRRREEAETFV